MVWHDEHRVLKSFYKDWWICNCKTENWSCSILVTSEWCYSRWKICYGLKISVPQFQRLKESQLEEFQSLEIQKRSILWDSMLYSLLQVLYVKMLQFWDYLIETVRRSLYTDLKFHLYKFIIVPELQKSHSMLWGYPSRCFCKCLSSHKWWSSLSFLWFRQQAEYSLISGK